ncbi:MAG: class I tRNA ligase family protein [Spirochaetaceae bacterium]|nr:class I tRNA ligase family protein [Spirochaetaceae bacterium]
MATDPPVGGVFSPVTPRVDFVALEQELLRWWDEAGIVGRYLRRNEASERRHSFIDGPITANNPMGVHHAWGRTYKDLFLRWRTMQGYRQRYQNGFDGQGLWVEVEVEKEKGFTSKHDIEAYGIGRFVEECKERVRKYAAIQTKQSQRLGYWMDWDDSYHTMSDENNYTIWHFLKRCHENGWLYRGTDSMPWCARCGTGLSQHEIVTEGYQDVTHTAVYVRLPLTDLKGRADNESLLVWTTTPWTLTANVAAAVHPEHRYVRARVGNEIVYLGKERIELLTELAGAMQVRPEDSELANPLEQLGVSDLLGVETAGEALGVGVEVLEELPGSALIGRTYRGPFDDLAAQRGVEHRVIPWDEVGEQEGTAIVHIAPGAGPEDFALGKEHGLAVVAPLDENGYYVDGFGWLTGQSVFEVRERIFADLEGKGLLYCTEEHRHRYPFCWRCNSELVFRVVDEWFISMDELRHTMMEITRKVRWIPAFGLERELDWLRNMHDWMISKKRYWGLALPIWTCDSCASFEVIGSEHELEERAVEGWDEFAGHSPHRPWIDAVKIECSSCGEKMSRIRDVGNPWLDAGIVPFSTIGYRHDREHWREWFPADWISESFPGQFRNWFYSLLAMSATLEQTEPFRACFTYALLRDEHGDEMHKSKGNAIWFEDAADQMGVDVMRWMYLRHTPANNLNFGYAPGDEVRRQFHIPIWNVYSFFVNYANIDGWQPVTVDGGYAEVAVFTELDRWIRSELHQTIRAVTTALETWRPETAATVLERFVDALSNWYVRRSRRRFWRGEQDTQSPDKPAPTGMVRKIQTFLTLFGADKCAAYQTLYECLTTLVKLLAPFTPFIAEAIYRNLVAERVPDAPASVHLCDWPRADEALIDEGLSAATNLAMRLSRLGRSARAGANLRVRQPLAELVVDLDSEQEQERLPVIRAQLLDELNVKRVRLAAEVGGLTAATVKPNFRALGPRFGRRMNEVTAAIAAAEASAVAAQAASGGPVRVGEFELQAADLVVETAPREAYAIAAEPGCQVGVLKELTPELRAEGMVREAVHMINNLRRESGFAIADRITLYVAAAEPVASALQTHETLLAAEVLATEVCYRSAPAGAATHQAAIAGHPVTFGAVRR